MVFCEKCKRADREVLLCDVLSRSGIIKMCEKCAKSDNLPILKMPSDSDAINFVVSREPRPPKMQMMQSNIQSSLIEKFNWHIQMARRRVGLTTKQLSMQINEPEESLKKLESGIELPKVENDKVVNKLEQLFRIKLKKDNGFIGSDLELADDVFNEKQ